MESSAVRRNRVRSAGSTPKRREPPQSREEAVQRIEAAKRLISTDPREAYEELLRCQLVGMRRDSEMTEMVEGARDEATERFHAARLAKLEARLEGAESLRANEKLALDATHFWPNKDPMPTDQMIRRVKEVWFTAISRAYDRRLERARGAAERYDALSASERDTLRADTQWLNDVQTALTIDNSMATWKDPTGHHSMAKMFRWTDNHQGAIRIRDLVGHDPYKEFAVFAEAARESGSSRTPSERAELLSRLHPEISFALDGVADEFVEETLEVAREERERDPELAAMVAQRLQDGFHLATLVQRKPDFERPVRPHLKAEHQHAWDEAQRTIDAFDASGS